MKKTCTKCGEIKSLNAFGRMKSMKSGIHYKCKMCINTTNFIFRNTERGYLAVLHSDMNRTDRISRSHIKCHLTIDELHAAFKKHKSIYGMRSAWGPGIDNLEKHLPITMIYKGEGQAGKRGGLKGSKRTLSNLSVDRLDSGRDYTLQNIIFIRTDENARKKDTSYEDCKIQIRLHEERFGK